MTAPRIVDSPTDWFLAFDSSCGFCASLSDDIARIAGNDIVLVSLHDPVVQEWRAQAFGESAAWTPTLIALDGGSVKAWTGTGLSVQLTRLIGPRRAWRLAQIIGGKIEPGDRQAVTDVSLLSRRNIIKGLSGAVASLAILNATSGQAAADSPGDCGLSTVNHWVDYRVRENRVNCRECPFSWSDVAKQLYQNDLFGTRHITYSGWYVNGSSTWMRSRGPIGCWIHASYLN